MTDGLRAKRIACALFLLLVSVSLVRAAPDFVDGNRITEMLEKVTQDNFYYGNPTLIESPEIVAFPPRYISSGMSEAYYMFKLPITVHYGSMAIPLDPNGELPNADPHHEVLMQYAIPQSVTEQSNGLPRYVECNNLKMKNGLKTYTRCRIFIHQEAYKNKDASSTWAPWFRLNPRQPTLVPAKDGKITFYVPSGKGKTLEPVEIYIKSGKIYRFAQKKAVGGTPINNPKFASTASKTSPTSNTGPQPSTSKNVPSFTTSARKDGTIVLSGGTAQQTAGALNELLQANKPGFFSGGMLFSNQYTISAKGMRRPGTLGTNGWQNQLITLEPPIDLMIPGSVAHLLGKNIRVESVVSAYPNSGKVLALSIDFIPPYGPSCSDKSVCKIPLSLSKNAFRFIPADLPPMVLNTPVRICDEDPNAPCGTLEAREANGETTFALDIGGHDQIVAESQLTDLPA